MFDVRTRRSPVVLPRPGYLLDYDRHTRSNACCNLVVLINVVTEAEPSFAGLVDDEASGSPVKYESESGISVT